MEDLKKIKTPKTLRIDDFRTYKTKKEKNLQKTSNWTILNIFCRNGNVPTENFKSI